MIQLFTFCLMVRTMALILMILFVFVSEQSV